MSEMVVKWGKIGEKIISLKSTVEMWARSAHTCPGVQGGFNCYEDTQNTLLDYLLSLSMSKTSGIGGLLAFSADSVLAHQNLIIFVQLFSRRKLDNKMFFAILVFNWSHIWLLQYGCLPVACSHNFLIHFFRAVHSLPTWLAIFKLFLESEVLFAPVRDLTLVL